MRGAEERDGVGDDLGGVALAALLCFPAAGLHAATHVDAVALADMLTDLFGLGAPEDDVVEFRTLLIGTRCFVAPFLVGGDTQRQYLLAGRRGAHLGIAGDVADDIGAVDALDKPGGTLGRRLLALFGIEEDEVERDDFGLAALLVRFFILPAVGLETAGEEQLCTGLHELAGDFRHGSPEGDRVEGLAIKHLARLGLEGVRDDDV